jgi:hypothetical protein
MAALIHRLRTVTQTSAKTFDAVAADLERRGRPAKGAPCGRTTRTRVMRARRRRPRAARPTLTKNGKTPPTGGD